MPGKNILLTIFLVFFNLCAFTQISLNDMIAVYKMDMDRFETYAISKGYSFDGIKEDEGYYGLSYTKGVGKNTKYLSLYNKFFTQRRCVTVQTSVENEYLNIKNQMTQLGFKLISTTNTDGSIKKVFKNNNWLVNVYSGILDDGPYSYYEINLFNNHYMDAMIAYENEDYKNAIISYNKAIPSLPNNECVRGLALSYYYSENYTNATIYFKQAIQANEDNADLSEELANTYYNLNDYKNAIIWEIKSIEYNNEDAGKYCSLGWYYILNQQPNEAEEYLKVGESMYGENKDYLYYAFKINLAHVKLLNGETEEAKVLYRAYNGELIDDETSWESYVINDLNDMKKRKVIPVQVDEMIKFLQSEPSE